MKIPTVNRIASISMSVFMAVTVSTAVAQTADNSPQQQIRTLLSITFDQPNHKVEASPIAVANDYAIADWIQGEKGGRALLRRTNGKWEIMACGGDALKDIKALNDAGISTATAKNIVAQLTKAEQSISADRVKRFGLFGMTDFQAHSKP